MADLQQRLQAAVGDSYRIEKELGGGGMSRVFLAEEVRLGRKVVIKVLPPEMGAGVNAERFEREIQLAAKLQHPHVVPLLTAGSSEDLLYYMMPYIEGESLRAKLAREGELPVSDAVKILKEVVDALAYAHRHGVVHRDIKPDNVLLSEGHATVADFGVAKAVSASTGASNLTSLGVALGTPAYMAPEQAVADPHVDHRADIYAVGAMAYEMLTGRPPFTGPNPQAVLSAHVTDAPEPATKFRTTVPESLNALVMRCLEKKAADRWQKAEELLPHLDSILTPTGGMTPTGTAPVPAVDYEALARQAHPIRVAALFGLGSAVALALVYWIMIQAGLPDWVFVGALILLAIGLPVMLMTGHHERKRALARTTGIVVTTPQQGIRRLFTWRKSLLGGGLAFAGLGVVATGYMATRLLGIGPAGTLVTKGVLEERDPILLAEFENRTTDSTLGPSVTDAFRVDLSQSSVVKLVDASAIEDALRRMELDLATPLEPALAREIAEREGIQAVVTGEIGSVGRGYVLSASLVSPVSREVLVAVRESADDDGEIIRAIDRLSKKLRERIGESLRSIRANEPLERVTTGSMDALRKYSQALRSDREGEVERTMELLEEAISLDTEFAMAYRKLAVVLSNSFAEQSRITAAARKAFEHRNRLPELERYLTTAYYYGDVEYDRNNVIRAYRAVLDLDPDELTALNNLSIELRRMRRWQEAEELTKRALELGSEWQFYQGTVAAQVAQGKLAEAQATIDQFAEKLPDNPYLGRLRFAFAARQRDYARAAAHAQAVAEQESELFWQQAVNSSLSAVARVQGKVASAERYMQEAMSVGEERGLPAAYITGAVQLGLTDVLYRETPADGVRKVEAALERYPISEMDPLDRPYVQLARFYALAGYPERARRLLSEYEAEVEDGVRRGQPQRYGAYGAAAFAEGRQEEAITHFRNWYDDGCGGGGCGFFGLGQVYDVTGNADSALAAYERALTTPALFRVFEESQRLGQTYKRLGELYEERGETEKAVEYYDRFVELWRDADDELQPIVRDVRDRIARLVGER